MKINKSLLEKIDEIGDNHQSINKETPIRLDAFNISKEQKIILMCLLFSFTATGRSENVCLQFLSAEAAVCQSFSLQDYIHRTDQRSADSKIPPSCVMGGSLV